MTIALYPFSIHTAFEGDFLSTISVEAMFPLSKVIELYQK